MVSKTNSEQCNVEVMLEAVGGKWKGAILYYLLDGAKRFSALNRLLPNVTQRMLTLQLRELEKDGLVSRHIYREIPPRVEYSLTELGMTLKPLLLLMSEWGAIYRQHEKRSEGEVSEVS